MPWFTHEDPHISRPEIEALARYNPATMREGWNTMPDGEEVFYISTPSAGLWSTREKLERRATHEKLA